MELGELFVTLGFHADTLKLKEFLKAVGELNMASVMGALGLGTLYDATSKIVNIADQTAMSVWNFSQITGVSQKQTQQFSNVVESMGGTADEAKGSLDGLQKSMLQVQLGRGNAEPFILTGISPAERDLFKVLSQLQHFLKTSNVKDSVKEMIVAEMGLSTALIPVLKNTEDINAAMEKRSYSTEGQIDLIRRYHTANKELGQSFKLLIMELAVSLEPIITEVLRLGESILKVLTSPIDQLFNRVTEVIQKIQSLVSTVISIIPFGKDLINSVNAWGNLLTKPFEKLISSAPSLSGINFALAGGKGNVSNDVEVNISGVSDPQKASDMAVTKLQRMLTDRYYHENNQTR